MSEGFENIITNAVASANIENSYPKELDYRLSNKVFYIFLAHTSL